MLPHIITPTSAYIFRMIQSYNDFIFPSIKKYAYTNIFIFLLYFLNITPTDLKILIFYSYKVLSCSFIYVF